MRALLFAALLIASTPPAFAAGPVKSPAPAGTVNAGTVNAFTPQQLARAKTAIAKAGRKPIALENVQDGNFFFIAIGSGGLYMATFTKAGELYFSNPRPVPMS